MTNSIRLLLAAAGGPRPLGMTLERYWFDLAVELEVKTGVQIEVRSLERAFREGLVSRRVKNALEKLAREKAKKDDLEFIKRVEDWLHWFEEHDPFVGKAELAFCWRVLPTLRILADLRGHVAAQISLIELAKAAERDAADEAAE